MKCNVATLAPFLCLSSLAHATPSSGFGGVAEQLLPQIGVGLTIISLVFGIISISLCIYTYNLWRISRRNPQMVPLNRVLLSLVFTLTCIGISLMDRPGAVSSIKPIPIVKQKKYEQGAVQPGYQNKHWSNKKSTQNSN